MIHYILGQEMCLLASKALFWPAKQMLIVADLHLGKAGHFRKSGIPIPSRIHWHDLQTLTNSLEKKEAKHLLFLGDLFHSLPNGEWLLFEEWLNEWLDKDSLHHATLVIGNHDEHGKKQLPPRLDLCAVYEDSNILLTHEPLLPSQIPADSYNLSGHLHPAIKIKLGALSQTKLPCFFFGEKQGVLPAFGKFNGNLTMKPGKTDTIFVIVEGQVMKY